MLTTIETCRLQDRNVFEYLTAAVEAHFAKRPAPSLLATLRTVAAFSTLLEHTELMLSLDEKARRKALAKTRRLQKEQAVHAS